MNCRACKKNIADDSLFCCYCGKKQKISVNRKKNGNGAGTVFQLPNGKWKAQLVVSYKRNDDGKIEKKTLNKTVKSRTEAMNALAVLKTTPIKTAKNYTITLKQLYEKWIPTHKAGKDTLNCYKAAMKHFSTLWDVNVADVDVDDLQECIDTCGYGKRTQENMRTVIGLIYKYGVPRRYLPEKLILSDYLTVSGEKGLERESFTEEQIQLIKEQIGITFGAEYIYCLIYLGFRPSEFLSLKKENYDAKNKVFIAGAKTEAGKNRMVTVSPKIQPYIEKMMKSKSEYLIVSDKGIPYDKDNFPEVMYSVLDAAGIENPMIESAGRKVHKYTPHSCRHTFATLMKRVPGDVKDKCKLIGHSSADMLRYYQSVETKDLKLITDAI